MAVLTSTDAAWLVDAYPSLVPSEDLSTVSGPLTFSAAYEPSSDLFAIIRSAHDNPPGIRFSGTYEILIKELLDQPQQQRALLPRLYIQDQSFPFDSKRHFNAGPQRPACLSGPSEEARLIEEGYLFPKFLEELCIPFLYAQSYYDVHGKWPWAEYDHDALGALQSYSTSSCARALFITLWVNLRGQAVWPRIHAILQSKTLPKGHMACLCQSGRPIRTCHPDVWDGLKKLYADTRAFKPELPPLPTEDGRGQTGIELS